MVPEEEDAITARAGRFEVFDGYPGREDRKGITTELAVKRGICRTCWIHHRP